jgi:hypothetical protein
MSWRIVLRVSPRQSPSSAILFEMSSDADWPWLARFFHVLILEVSDYFIRETVPKHSCSPVTSEAMKPQNPESRRALYSDPH